jgi:predicted transcriptional regulator
MNTILKRAVAKMSALPDDAQEYAASVLEQIAASGGGVYRLSDQERDLVRDGLADLDAGRIVTDADMDAFWKRHRG